MSVLYNRYEKSILADCAVSNTDEAILELVEEHEVEYYDGLIPSDSSWDVFMNLSRMRNSLLNWYDFSPGADILEINSGYGALTGLLCDRGGQVTALESSMLRARILNKRYSGRENLRVCAGDLDDISEEQKFDYIVAVGVLEGKRHQTIAYVKRLLNMLRPSGKLLIAVENRYGAKYFCGETNDLVSTPFGGINRSLSGDRGLFSRQELIDCVVSAGSHKYKIFYPMPDYKLTQAVYTDEYMPKGSIRDRIIPYYMHPENLVALEDRIYDDLIRNKVLHFFANSFLVECSLDAEEEKAIYAALSTDRERAHAFATVIQNDDTVVKRALYPEGTAVLQSVYENLCSICGRGISIVPVRIQGGCLEMPFIREKNLADLLAEMIHRDREEFEATIEKLYQEILRSSEHVSISQSALNMKKIPEEEIGAILKEAYIDMIPYNCFYSDGVFSFYDQEFKRENFPAKYVLFRVLRYMYFYIPDAERIIPLQYFKEKYLLVRLWGIFEKEEAQFIDENRNSSAMEQFYKWTRVDEEILPKCEEMTSARTVQPEEYDYENDEQLKAVKEVQLDLLKYFSGFCQKYDLRYCAIYGTLLGAVRHRGFIPWDDDIDLAMPREDYERLKVLAEEKMEEPYFFQIPENDPECFYGGYGKLRNSMTGGLEGINSGHKCNQGIWIDIFPLDVCYEDEEKRRKHIGRINFVQQLLRYKVYPERKWILNDVSGGRLHMIKMLSRFISHKRLCRYLDELIRGCGEESDKLAILSRYMKPDKVAVFEKEDFAFAFPMEFEDTKISVPVGYKNWLYKNVGEDYMIYPRPKFRVPHHTAKFAVERSYREMI